ncbi:hypothetical protein FHG87_014820 [Trinorchestia longiramus]|nr:hypothetical protein FHG87_014820 [Trinorchestia longiramus]
MFSSYFSFNNGAGLNSHFAGHQSFHRGHQHSYMRRNDGSPGAAPTAPGPAASRNSTSGRNYERFRTPHSRDNPRPGMRHGVSFGRMCTNVSGRGRLFEETVEGDLFGESNNTNPTGTSAPENENDGPVPAASEQPDLAGDDDAGAASAPPAEEPDDGKLHCPFCPYALDNRNAALFDEHIDSHLEFICPVCSTAFQRTKQAEYEAHVNGHFSEEEAARTSGNGENSSGPWSENRFMEFD